LSPTRSGDHTRGTDKLTAPQRTFLEALLQCGDWHEACAETGVSPRRASRWIRTDTKFGAAYNNLFGGMTEGAKKALEFAAMEATGLITEAAKAEKGIKEEITCPGCGEKFTYESTVPDHAIRLKVGELLLKAGGLIVDRKKVEVDVTHLNLAEKIALAMIQADPSARIPPAMLRKFQGLRLLEAQREDDSHIIEGEVVSYGEETSG